MTRIERLLRRARRLVARAWSQGSANGVMVSGGVCAAHALEVAAGRSRRDWAIVDAARRALVEGAGLTPPAYVARPVHYTPTVVVQTLTTWNDARLRTQAEVVAGFDRAIAYERRRTPA